MSFTKTVLNALMYWVEGKFSKVEKDLTNKQPIGDYALKNSVVPVPAKAEVGQTIVVKVIDESGMPTEWECADMPSEDTTSGGSEPVPLPLLADVTLEEVVSRFEVTLSKRAVKKVVMQITVSEDEGISTVCYGRLNNGLWDGFIFGNSVLKAGAIKWLELEFVEGNLAKYLVSNSTGNLWSVDAVHTCGKLEMKGYVDSIGIVTSNSGTIPVGTRIQVWGE